MTKGLGIFNIIYALFVVLIASGGPSGPPFCGIGALLLLILYLTLGIITLRKKAKAYKIILRSCGILTLLVLFTSVFYVRKGPQSWNNYSDSMFYAGIFLVPFLVNFIKLIRSKAKNDLTK